MKRALLFANNYRGDDALRGCVNDARELARVLRRRGFRVTIRTEFGRDRFLNDLAAAAREASGGDEVFVAYSGHGVSVPDKSGDESDGLDEAVYCADGRLAIDDEIAYVLRTFPENCRVRMLMDCCHSGTIGDLPFEWDERCRTCTPAGGVASGQGARATWGGRDVMVISGCTDAQESADAYDRKRRKYMGALTSAFVDNEARASDTRALVSGIRASLAARRMQQVPVLSSTREHIEAFLA